MTKASLWPLEKFLSGWSSRWSGQQLSFSLFASLACSSLFLIDRFVLSWSASLALSLRARPRIRPIYPLESFLCKLALLRFLHNLSSFSFRSCAQQPERFKLHMRISNAHWHRSLRSHYLLSETVVLILMVALMVKVTALSPNEMQDKTNREGLKEVRLSGTTSINSDMLCELSFVGSEIADRIEEKWRVLGDWLLQAVIRAMNHHKGTFSVDESCGSEMLQHMWNKLFKEEEQLKTDPYWLFPFEKLLEKRSA